LQPTLSVSFLDHVFFPEVSAYRLHFRLLEDRLEVRFSDDLELHILELPKFTKSAAELRTDLDIWLYISGTRRPWIQTTCPRLWQTIRSSGVPWRN
jgi:hypothetical protein